MNKEQITKAYELAKEQYAALGVNVDDALKKLQKISISLHCWQTDDVKGFENPDGQLSGGIQATGNYPGKARNIEEVRADLLKAASLIPGSHRVNLHAIYGDFGEKFVDRDEIGIEHFESWIEWAKENNLKLDFNSSSFSHPQSGMLTLSHPDKSVRDFWICHTQRCRAISEEIGKRQNDPCIMNIWVHDGSKETPVNKFKYRQHLADSLDQIFATKYDNMKDCLESKLFGIGAESYTVGSHEFYMGYTISRNKMITLDMGHYHLTESVADKISSLLLFAPEIMLHVSRPVRWDSDHVVTLSDDVVDLAKEIVRADALDRVHVGLDFFDASINRIGAYVVGTRSTQKAFLLALLEPINQLREYEANESFFERLALIEETKNLSWNAIWNYFCMKNNTPVGTDFIAEVQQYEKDVTSKR